MATIITVHGTFATGVEDGSDWWQRGSAFEQDIRKFVETQDGVLDFQPHIWDGANSELSRRAAANSLKVRMQDLNKRGESYCVVGHSHGGSVVARAVFDLCADKATTKALSRWITIGTPFIEMTKRKLLLSRLGLFGKTLYLTCFLLCMWAAALFIYSAATPGYVRKVTRREDINVQWDGSLVVKLCLMTIIAFLPFLLAHLGFWIVELRKMRIHSKKRWKAFALWAGPRWAGLWHIADEAMQGLKAAPRIAFPIFSDRFLVAPLSLATVFVSPPLLALVLSWMLHGQQGMASESMMSPVSPFGPENPFSAIGIIFERLSGAYDLLFRPADVDTMSSVFRSPSTTVWARLLAAGTLLLAFVLLALLLLGMISIISRLLSIVLSRTLDRVTWAQLRQSVFGNDTIGELAAGADARPMWYSYSPPPLPTELGQELTEHANLAAARSVPKMRTAVQVLAFSEEERAKSDLLSEYLTWEELIHTSYFSVPRFRMLVAYAIAHSEGFRPSPAFKSHPDYELVARWYEEIQPKPIAAEERGPVRALITNLQQGEQKRA
jgi:hypothetical protein